jgi:hypothetical protein
VQDKGLWGEIIAEEATVLKGSGNAWRVISVLVGGRGWQYGKGVSFTIKIVFNV